METKHTLGPWVWVADDSGYPTTDLVGRNGRCVMQVYESHGGGGMPKDNDARLIAAAPEMLEACRYIVAAGETGDEMLAIERARAAIAKATKT